MKRLPLLSAVMALGLAMGTPALAHVGHGDEFQAEGGINRVEVNAETDPILGIQAAPIELVTDDGVGVMVPVTALVEDNGRQLVFVLYENFYEPVPVTTGATQGELIEILEGLSLGEQLVTQGSLSLYAESRKTQTAEAQTAEVTTAAPEATQPDTPETLQSDKGVSDDIEIETNEAVAAATETSSGSKPQLLISLIGGGVVLVLGALGLLRGTRNQKSTFADETYGSKQENL